MIEEGDLRRLLSSILSTGTGGRVSALLGRVRTAWDWDSTGGPDGLSRTKQRKRSAFGRLCKSSGMMQDDERMIEAPS